MSKIITLGVDMSDLNKYHVMTSEPPTLEVATKRCTLFQYAEEMHELLNRIGVAMAIWITYWNVWVFKIIKLNERSINRTH